MTRPEAQSLRFADAFRARFGRDWPVLISPLTQIVLLEPGPPPDAEADLVFTSENAVIAYASRCHGRGAVAWCVGERTAQAAREAGFITRVGPGDAVGLVRVIIAGGEARRLIWPRPVHAAYDIASDLNSAGIETISWVIYDQQSCEPTPQAVSMMALPDPVLLPLFSARSALIAGAVFARSSAQIDLAAFSDAVAIAAAGLPARHSIVAARPDSAAMLDALAALIGPDKMA